MPDRFESQPKQDRRQRRCRIGNRTSLQFLDHRTLSGFKPHHLPRGDLTRSSPQDQPEASGLSLGWEPHRRRWCRGLRGRSATQPDTHRDKSSREQRGFVVLIFEGESACESFHTYTHPGFQGAVSLAAALKKNKSLKILYAGANNIGDEGTAALALALKTNNTLTQLNLGGNDVGDSGGAALANALQTNHTLASLNLEGNKISKKYMDRVVGYLSRNTQDKSWEDKLRAKRKEENNPKLNLLHLRAWEGDKEAVNSTIAENADLVDVQCSRGTTNNTAQHNTLTF